MNPAQLLAHFDRIAEAPEAIPRLRRFILDLAVRGKLVEQDPKDEPASELFKRIRAEKERLVKAGEIPKANPLPPVEPGEVPFGSPTGWKWARIRQVTSDRGQAIPDKEFTYIDVTAINKKVGAVTNARVLSANDAPSRARKIVRTGDVLYSCVRPYLLNIAVVEGDIVPSPIASTAFAVLNGFGLILAKYLWIALRSSFMVECIEAKMRGQAYPAINDSDFSLLTLPLPPHNEQQRIVAQVDELMELCDRLEAAQAERERRRDRLVAASLQRLTQPVDAGSFCEHARFYLNHLQRLSTRPEHVRQLRQTILDLAVRGKLVEQDPNDEPASELLKRIRAEKELFVKQGKAGLEPTPRVIPDDQVPFGLPVGWCWVRFGELITDADAGTSPRTESFPRTGDNWGVLKVSAVSWERFLPEENKQLLPGVSAPESARVHAGDFLISRANTSELVAKCVVVEIEPRNLVLSDKTVRLRISGKCIKRFLHMVNNYAGYARAYYAKEASGTSDSMKNVSRAVIYSLAVPLPPFEEQRRIVAKVDGLMALCDRLESRLTEAQTESCRLLESLLDEALNGKTPSTGAGPAEIPPRPDPPGSSVGSEVYA